MIKTLAYGCMLLYFYFAQAQEAYTGHLYDVGTRADLVHAEVELKHKGVKTFSNSFGDFVLTAQNSEAITENFSFLRNAIIWEQPGNYQIQITALNGDVILKHLTIASNTYLLPRMKLGIYILTINQEGGAHQSFKIRSDGKESLMVDKRGVKNIYKPYAANDTLVVSKEGYLTREIVTNAMQASYRIGLLGDEYQNLQYLNELIDPVAFELLSSLPSRSNLGDVREVKIIYDRRKDAIFYMNTKAFELHYTFAEQVLGYNKGHFIFNQTQYTANPARYLDLGGLFYYKGIDKYVLQFVTAVEMSCTEVNVLYNKILQTSFLQDQLYFFGSKDEWQACKTIPLITSEELYAGQTYQGMNEAENYGYLKYVSADELPLTYVSRRDIVVTDGVPNDLPVVAGIITSKFQTPLSHINVLSNSRNTPNMALRDAWTSEDIHQLSGKLVYLKVRADGYELREATLNEATAFWSKHQPQKTIYLQKDTNDTELVDLDKANYRDVKSIGGKAANFAEILKVRNPRIPTPENAFAIPFHYYEAHLKAAGLDIFIDQMRSDAAFQSDATYRQLMLQTLRDSIISAPLDPNLITQVKTKIQDFQNFDAFRFRSSTNAEDLETFSGAGLYDSYSAKKNHQSKTVEAAIKKVYASLWNWRAFEERDYFKIDHQSCAMGVLVHRSFPDEDANGVLLTKNLYNPNPGFIINVQYKEYSIVYPEPGIIHDQIIYFNWSVRPNENHMIEYQSHSNVPELNGTHVMRDAEIVELSQYAEAVKRRFYYDLPHDCDCVYKDFGVDIEFKVDSDVSPRKVYIKQVRLYR